MVRDKRLVGTVSVQWRTTQRRCTTWLKYDGRVVCASIPINGNVKEPGVMGPFYILVADQMARQPIFRDAIFSDGGRLPEDQPVGVLADTNVECGSANVNDAFHVVYRDLFPRRVIVA